MTIEMEHVEKSFGSHRVIKDVHMQIHSGDIMLMVGKNGAGKTTILRLLLGLYKPDSGHLVIDGIDVGTSKFKSIKKRIGFLNDHIGLFQDLSAWDNIEFFYRIYNEQSSKKERDRAIEKVLRQVDLYDEKDRRIDFFSGGMRQRLALARAIVHKPELLILDEPYRGLDVEGKEMLKRIIQQYHNDGATVLMNSHDLNDIQEYVTHLSFLSKGEIAYSGSYGELLKKQQDKKYKILVENPKSVLDDLRKAPFVKRVEEMDEALFVTVTQDSKQLSDWLYSHRIRVYELTQVNGDLVSFYKQFVE